MHDSTDVNEIQKTDTAMNQKSDFIYQNMLMNYEMIKGFSAKEIARLEDRDVATIIKNKKRYIAVRIDNSITRTKERGYAVKYIRVCDLQKYIREYL